MSFGDTKKGAQKKVGNRVEDIDEDDTNYGATSKKKREISYKPREVDDDDDDGNQEFERPSRTKNARNAAEDDAQEAEEMRKNKEASKQKRVAFDQPEDGGSTSTNAYKDKNSSG